jgi:phosphoserine phosphatase
MPKRRVLFVDLDRTLVLENTFHVFLRALALIRGHGARIALLRYASHKLPTVRTRSAEARRIASKSRLMSWFAQLPADLRQGAIDRTVSSAVDAVSPQVTSIIDEWRADGAVVVLATAAPDAYVHSIAQTVKADHVISSREDTGLWRENVGAQKAEACKEWLKEQTPIHAMVGVITDHADDIPLLRIADRAYIHASPQEAARLASLAALAPGHWETLDPTSPQPDGGWWFYVNGLRGPLDDPEARILLSKWRDCLVYTNDGWVAARGGYRAIEPLKRRDPPMMPSVVQRARMEVETWLRRRILRMTH